MPAAAPPPRIVTLVLVDRAGTLLGALPPFQAETPWWQDFGPVVHAVRDRHGLAVTLLRFLEAERPCAPGGAVTYLGEVDRVDVADVPLRAWSGRLRDHPLRLPWARPGGPRADLEWARAELAAQGIAIEGLPEQVRSWNLSSLWRLPTSHGHAWLKAVPPFLAHEGAVLRLLQGQGVPRLLAHDGHRVLLAEVPGEDRYDAGGVELPAMVDALVALQARWISRIDALEAAGMTDWRADALAGRFDDALQRHGADLDPADVDALRRLRAQWPALWAEVQACGLPDTLVHGDAFPGNFRRRTDDPAAPPVLLDWGDSGIGHPLLDQAAFLDRIAPADVPAVRAHWSAAWQRACPGCDPERAAALLAPIVALVKACVYRRFLDGIEPDEHPYHRDDVPDWLRRAAAACRARGDGAVRPAA